MEKGKLSEGPPNTAHIRVSLAVMWKRLEALDAIVNDPAKVKKWSDQTWRALDKCQVVP